MTVETVNRTLARFTRDAIISVAKRGVDFLDRGGSNRSRKAPRAKDGRLALRAACVFLTASDLSKNRFALFGPML